MHRLDISRYGRYGIHRAFSIQLGPPGVSTGCGKHSMDVNVAEVQVSSSGSFRCPFESGWNRLNAIVGSGYIWGATLW